MQQLVKTVSTSTLLATVLALSGCGGDGKDSRSLSLEQKGTQNIKLLTSAVNKAPTSEDYSFSIHKLANYFGQLKAVDSDGDELIFTIKDTPKMGNVVLEKNGMFVYTSCSKSGEDSFSFIVSDGISQTEQNVTITAKDTTTLTKPKAPSDFTITRVDETSATLSWSDNSDDEEYFVIIDKNDKPFAVVDQDTTEVTLTGLNPSTSYEFLLLARNEAGYKNCSTASLDKADIKTLPLAPTDLKVVAQDDTSLRFSWLDNAKSETGYAIYQDGKLVKTVSANISTVVIQGLEKAKSYNFTVVPFNDIFKATNDSTNALSLTVKFGKICKALLKTGQTVSYQAGDDGDLQKGAERSYTRDDDRQIVTDNVTGLIWQDDVDAKSVEKTWQGAIDYCEVLNLGGFSDWKLPTSDELASIVDYGRYEPSINPTFENIVSNYYWSSTIYASNTSDAWFVYFGNGNQYNHSNNRNNYVRCVRAGE